MSFDSVFEQVLTDIKDGKNVMLHGAGGVGKTHLIKKLRDNVKKPMHLTSTTGVSAFNVGDGCTTINSFAGVFTGDREPLYYVKKNRSNQKRLKIIKDTRLLVIDEVSMLGKKMLELIDIVFKAIRQDGRPFGGIQVLFSGDFFQLPPVKDKWCFTSKVWSDLAFCIHTLKKPQRHKADKSFFKMLMRIREGKHKHRDLVSLQKRHIKYFEMSESDREKLPAVMLFPTNKNVDHYNNQRLDELDGEKFPYTATYSNKEAKKASGCILNDIIILKKGAQVMLTSNLDVSVGLVNGSTGIVTDCGKGYVCVEFVNGISHVIECFEYIIDDEQNIKAWQIPLKLAWAISIHKSQSATIPLVVIDLGECFEKGQAYVALSRCGEMDGVYLTDFNPKSIKVDSLVLDFMGEKKNYRK